MKLSRDTYKQWLAPELTPNEINGLWAQIADRVAASPTKPRPHWWLAAAAVFGLALGVAFSYRGVSSVSLVGQTVGAPLRGNRTLQLPDGSSASLLANSKLRVVRLDEKGVRLELFAGVAEFDVTHVEGRSFVVAAGGVEVIVVGTRFRVSVAEAGQRGGVEVAVERGRVRVIRGNGRGEVALQAPERWSSAPGITESDSALPAAFAGLSPPEPSVAPASSGAQTPVPDRSEAARRPPATAATTVDAAPATPAKIFERATRARVAGDARQGAALFEKLIKEYRSDSRAGLSALELGRLRLDEFGDASGAASALADALALGLRASLRDDALARLAEAQERSGNIAACRRTRKLYLTSLPQGTHRAVVARRCPGG